jgi:hypothetical protein
MNLELERDLGDERRAPCKVSLLKNPVNRILFDYSQKFYHLKK